MSLRKPVAKNKKEKPVIIFQNYKEIDEFPSIQAAARGLKALLGLQHMPYQPIMKGILYHEDWEYNGQVYSFTTDENVRLATLEQLKEKQKVNPTGYWTFFCNPGKWAIDDFLSSGRIYDTFSITEWQKEWFKKGQLGVIRVGRDSRTKQELSGKSKLKRGIYAVVEILDQPFLSSKRDEFWSDQSYEDERYRVPVKYVKSLLKNPILLEDLDLESTQKDKYLTNGFQGSSMPLNPLTFKHLLDKIGNIESLDLEVDYSSGEDILTLEERYKDAVPEVKERVSRYIERGTIAQKYKKEMGFKCQVCEAMGLHPYSFKKPNGDYYIETHHVIPVSALKAGSLSTSNLITVCANHHRQIHYGNVELIGNTDEYFVYTFDGKNIKINKLKE